MKKPAIVIPTHKKELSELEKISLEQAVKIFEGYDKFFVLPYSLEILYPIGSAVAIRFADCWFTDNQAYNNLLMTEEFYKKFAAYEYILLYQLDAFVFEDKLEYFCDLGYDYIGAPWLTGLQYVWNYKNYILHVGNGGFSLRNVKKCMDLIEKKREFFSYYMNEDQFFALGSSDDFKVAPMEIALQFAFEREVENCFEMNGNKLPFGCHAWERYNLKFWRQYIECCGYKIDDQYLLDGYEDLAYREELNRQRKMNYFWEQIYKNIDLEKFLNKQEKKIYVWGAGWAGHFLGKLLSETDTNIEGYLDSNAALIGTYIEKYKVLPVGELTKNRAGVYIIIAVDRHRNEIAEQLDKIGYRYHQDYIFYKDIFRMLAEAHGSNAYGMAE